MAICPNCETKLKIAEQTLDAKTSSYICPNVDCRVIRVKIEMQ